MNNKLFLGWFGLAIATASAGIIVTDENENSEEHKAVERACLDYVEGIYDVDPELIKRGVHPDMQKYGFWHDKEKNEYRGTAMNFTQLCELAGKWNADGRAGKDPPKKVEVFDVLDKTASAKLTAAWGTDYFHLIKEDGKWMIYQVLWQSPMPDKE